MLSQVGSQPVHNVIHGHHLLTHRPTCHSTGTRLILLFLLCITEICLTAGLVGLATVLLYLLHLTEKRWLLACRDCQGLISCSSKTMCICVPRLCDYHRSVSILGKAPMKHRLPAYILKGVFGLSGSSASLLT